MNLNAELWKAHIEAAAEEDGLTMPSDEAIEAFAMSRDFEDFPSMSRDDEIASFLARHVA